MDGAAPLGTDMASPTGYPAATSASPSRPSDEEVTELYHELQRCAGKLEQEKALRKRVESELEDIRTQRLRETADVVEDLERKRTELHSLREERSQMKEWLDRGVTECKRVADDVARLKAELDVSERTCTTLAREKQKLTNTVQQMNEELATVQTALEKVHEEKTLLDNKSNENAANLTAMEDERQSAVNDADRMSAEIARLSQRVRSLDDAELSLQSMCNVVSALSGEIQNFERAIVRGDVDEILPHPPLADAANNVGEQKPVATLVVDAKRLMQQLRENISRLHVAVKRFVAEKQSKHTEAFRAQEIEREALTREKDVVMRQYESERDMLRRRVQDLEMEIVSVAEGVQHDVAQQAQGRLEALDKISKTNAELTLEAEKLQEDNDKLRAKAKKMRVDWTKVEESRRRYQQLQIEVQLMREHNERLVVENRNLKLMMDANAAAASPGRAAGSPGPNAGLGHAQSAIAMQRQAFEEWKLRMAGSDTTHIYQ